MKTLTQHENTLTNLLVRNIDLSEFEIRHKENQREEDFQSLVESIKQQGILQPIQVVLRGNHYEVIDGGRRIRAARVVGLAKIPTIIVDQADQELEIRKRALIANVHRKDLEPEERGEALVQYYKCAGFTDPEEIVYLLGRIYNKGRHDGGSRGIKPKPIPENFMKLQQIAIPVQTQQVNIQLVTGADPEVLEEAKKENLWHTDKMKLVSKDITKYKAINPEGVKRQQKEMIASLAAARNTARNYQRRQSQSTVELAADQLHQQQKAGRKDRKMTQEESLEAIEADRISKKMDIRKIYGNVNGALSNMWEALTQQKYIPAGIESDQQLLDKHIKPTREFRQYLANGIEKDKRTLLGNWLLFVRMAIEDMEKILEKADKTAFDTRDN